MTTQKNVKFNEEYDPHDYRNVRKPMTNFEAFMNFLNASIGTGLLSMPYAFAHAGYAIGGALTALIGIIAIYCLHVLIGSVYELCKRKRVPYLTYSNAMKLALQDGPPISKCIAPFAPPFVDGFLAFYHFGICCVYIVFIAEIVKQISDQYWLNLDIRIHMCFLLVPVCLMFSITNLQLLTPFSFVGNALLVVGFAIILYYILRELPSLSERKAFEDTKKLPIFFGIVLFALEAVGVILAIEENMETPKAYIKPFGIMNIGLIIVLTIFISMGFFGYWSYGDDSLYSVTLNIPQSEKSTQFVKLLFAVKILISYSLHGYVTADVIWNKCISKRVKDTSKHAVFEIMVRASIVLLSFALAIAIPQLSLFLELVGSFCLSILGIIFPALLQICVQYPNGYGPWKIRLVKNVLLILFGAFGGVICTYAGVLNLFAYTQK